MWVQLISQRLWVQLSAFVGTAAWKDSQRGRADRMVGAVLAQLNMRATLAVRNSLVLTKRAARSMAPFLAKCAILSTWRL